MFVYLGEQDAQQGTLCFTVLDAMGQTLQTDMVQLEEIGTGKWQKITLKGRFDPGVQYALRMTNQDAKLPIRLLTLAEGYIPEENLSGRVPIRYSYNLPTFSSQEKLLITLAAIGLWLLAAAGVFFKQKERVQKTALCLLLTILLAWNVQPDR